MDRLQTVRENIFYSRKGFFVVKDKEKYKILDGEDAKTLPFYEKFQAKKILVAARVTELERKKLDQIKKNNDLTSNSEAIGFLINNF